VNILIRGGTVITCDAHDRVVSGDVLVCGREVAAVGQISCEALTRVLDARGCAVIPGLVQAHVHLAQTLMRGMAEDLPLLDWLRKRVWPLEAAHDEVTLASSAELGLAEAMLGGTTTLLDMGTVRAHDVVMDACARAGVRAISGKAMMDVGEGVPRGLRESARASLSESERLAARWRGAAGGRLGYAWAPGFVMSCSEGLARGVVERARDKGDLIHTHAAEHLEEREAVRKAHGDDDVAVLRQWGIAGPRVVVAHGVHLRDDEARQVARDGTRVVHCPSANLKLGSGIARIAELDRLGVALALGADGAPCNNNLDAWTELRYAALLAKVRSGPRTLPAKRALRMATIDGARALGIDSLVGSIEPGKRADLAVVRIDGPHAEPGGDVFSRLVFACGARDVVHVLVDGELVVKDATHVRLDVERVKATAREQARRLLARAKI
jgi:cytosine/adenosine deaminase-related metal-dependent hydrolase